MRWTLPLSGLVVAVAAGVACSAIIGIDDRAPYGGGGASGVSVSHGHGSVGHGGGNGGTGFGGGGAPPTTSVSGNGGGASCPCTPGFCETCVGATCHRMDGSVQLDGCGMVDCVNGEVVHCSFAPCTAFCFFSGASTGTMPPNGHCDGQGHCIENAPLPPPNQVTSSSGGPGVGSSTGTTSCTIATGAGGAGFCPQQ